MKKLTAILLSLLMVVGLAACSGNTEQTGQSSTPQSAENSSPAGTTDNESSAPTDSSSTPDKEEGTLKVLVAYFSATGTTEGVAEHIANGLNADIYEIVPEQPYTSADLDWNDNDSRSTIEMNDPNARPAISGSVENMEQYDVVFIGYPIWWGEAPRIVSTFMESYHFAGKTIVPFCTSGGSGMGSSASNLEKLTSNAVWLDGQRLNGSDSQDEVMEWVDSLGLDK
ncbi:flavodoxin [Youxingia wuxianensis]|uniref:NAD(P)H-dependent oxidoreductase n=1 Tax=Youxingia wuxianensis TaxID=2763678 RepID=A0A926ERY8_9FIRM|nr:flavodoxin [Youxingia wuxianensis]MBC8585190.1 NAD(P)H-dependent oxidoreductase [Youxingia wuxianensis]